MHTKRILAIAATAAFTVATVVGIEHAAGAVQGERVAVAADLPAPDNGGGIVEDGAYPGADDIEAQQHIHLVSGNGHLVLADCATPPVNDIGVLKVWTTEEVGADGIGLVCFQVLAKDGLLNLSVPGVYEIRGDGQRAGTGHDVTATVTTDAGVTTSKPVDPDGSTQFGIGEDPNGDPTTLLRLRVTG